MAFTEEQSNISNENQHKYALESKQMDIDAGLIGKIFGTSQAAPINIAGFIAIVLTMAGVLSLFIDATLKPDELWKIIVPILSMILGYLFGKKS
jgi:uncharacterized membrane protein HdeD (DUF308 family)